uniref:Uncharacterized protein n=1 Tax=viral metagenome TaxID=1070528 RepID=A0A6C0IAD9_9ZZZZ
MASDVSRKQLQDAIKNTKNSFLKADPNQLQDYLYKSYEGISKILLNYKQGGGAAGWSASLDGYTPEEHAQLETAMKQLGGFIDPIFLQNQVQLQQGGSDFKPGVSPDSMVSYSEPFGTINPDDISIDKTYNKLKAYIANLDEQNRILAKTLGPFRFIDELKVDPILPLPPPLIPLKIPAKAIIPAIMTFLELLRVFVSFGPMSNDFLRKTLSLVLAFGDISTGSWKNAVLSALGAFGQYPLLLGIIGKLLNNTFQLMSPEIQTQLSDSIFKGAKSIFVGFWLYLFSILSPDAIRASVNNALEQLKTPLEEFNKKIGDLQAKVESELAPKGLSVTFPTVPMNMVPSLEDIQNIQVLAARPEIYCSPEFQNAIDPLMKEVPTRLVLELMGVPTQSDEMAAKCKGVPTDVAEAATEKLQPVPQIIPGGPLNLTAKMPNRKKIAFAPTPVRRGGGSRKYKKTRRSKQSRRSRR